MISFGKLNIGFRFVNNYKSKTSTIAISFNPVRGLAVSHPRLVSYSTTLDDPLISLIIIIA